MSDVRELFITGLKNAHSMEHNAQEMLERQVERLDDYSELKSKLSSHLEETRAQLDS
jgi:ferritin-like metal-binding protein YciE